MASKIFNKVDSSDYITYKKRITIAGEYVKVNTVNELTSTKTNGNNYNQNFRFIPTIVNPLPPPTTDASNCLIQAKNHELKQDYSAGINNIKLLCD